MLSSIESTTREEQWFVSHKSTDAAKVPRTLGPALPDLKSCRRPDPRTPRDHSSAETLRRGQVRPRTHIGDPIPLHFVDQKSTGRDRSLDRFVVRREGIDQASAVEAAHQSDLGAHAFRHLEPRSHLGRRLLSSSQQLVDRLAKAVGPGLGIALGQDELGRRVSLGQSTALPKPL